MTDPEYIHTHNLSEGLVGRRWDSQDVLVSSTNQVPASVCNEERECEIQTEREGFALVALNNSLIGLGQQPFTHTL